MCRRLRAQKLHHAEVRAELVRFARPDTVFADAQDKQGRITSDHSFQSPMTTSDMFVAFQQRCVQTRWMIHRHSLGYCLKCGRCRLFFPFCVCAEQKHDDAINRMLHIRRNAADDGMVATHILECLLVGDTCARSGFLPNQRFSVGRALHSCVRSQKTP